MAQANNNKLYRTFVKGLITEASPLTYPEDSSLDELNTQPSRKGNRTRRFGINYSADNVVARTYVQAQAKNEYVWPAVGSNSALTFLVVQNGATITFFDRTQATFSTSLKSFIINLNNYARPGVSDVSGKMCKFASGKGYLFIVQSDIEPVVVSYDLASDTISPSPITILGRDFEGLNDGLANDAEPTQLSTAHFYNLLTQGWITPTS